MTACGAACNPWVTQLASRPLPCTATPSGGVRSMQRCATTPVASHGTVAPVVRRISPGVNHGSSGGTVRVPCLLQGHGTVGQWGRATRRDRRRREVRCLLRAPAAQAVAAARRVRAAAERPRPDRAGRQAGLRLRLGGGAPLPRGVQPFVGARGVPRRGQPAHQGHPARSRHRAAPHQPPRPGRRAGEHARPDQPRAGGAGCRRGVERDRAPPLRSALPGQARGVGGRHALPHADVLGGGLGVPRRVLRLPPPQRGAQAVPAAAPSAVGGVQPARHDRHGRPARPRRTRLPVRVGRGGPRLGERLLQRLHQAARTARSLRHEPQHRGGEPVHVRAHRRGGPRPRRRVDVLPVRARLLQHQGTRRPWHREPVGRVPGVEADAQGPGRPARRPHRLARHDPRQAGALRGVQRRPGHPAEPGRPQPTRAHL